MKGKEPIWLARLGVMKQRVVNGRGNAEGQVIVSLQVQDRNYQPLISSLQNDPNVIDILDGPPKPVESS